MAAGRAASRLAPPSRDESPSGLASPSYSGFTVVWLKWSAGRESRSGLGLPGGPTERSEHRRRRGTAQNETADSIAEF